MRASGAALVPGRQAAGRGARGQHVGAHDAGLAAKDAQRHRAPHARRQVDRNGIDNIVKLQPKHQVRCAMVREAGADADDCGGPRPHEHRPCTKGRA